MAGSREKYLSAGFDSYLSKPVSLQALKKVMHGLLPQNLIQDVPAEEFALEEEEFSVKKNIDEKLGLSYCAGSLDIYRTIAEKYIDVAPVKRQCILDALEGKNWTDLLIEVHALKSTARTIGAMDLSEKFFMLEKAGDKNDLDTIMSETEKVLSEYNALKEVLRPYADDGDDSEKREASDDEIIDLLSAIKESADAFDLDGVDSALSSLKEIRLPEELTDHMTRLTALVADVATDEIMEEADIIINLLKKER